MRNISQFCSFVWNTVFWYSHFYRPNPLQYFLVPDIEVENGGDDEDLDDEEEVDENVVVMEEEEGEEEEEEAGEEEGEGEEK